MAATPGEDDPTEAVRRVKAEATFTTLIDAELQRQLALVKAAGEEPAQIRAAIEALGDDPKMRDVLAYVLAQGTDLGVSIAVDQLAGAGISFDYRLVNEEARRWAQNYSYELVRGIDATTQTVLRTELEAWTSTGEPYSGLVRRLAPTFGRQRAKLIATTEITRAYAEGSMAIYQASGVVTGVEWLTAGPAACKICAPLQGKIFPLVGLVRPPLHPGCVCGLAPVVPSPEEVDARERALTGRPAEALPATAPVAPPAVPASVPRREAPKRMVPDRADAGPVVVTELARPYSVDAPGPIPEFAIPAQPQQPQQPQYQPARGQLTAAAKHVNEQLKDIAAEYGVTAKTVERTIDKAFAKLTAESRIVTQFESKYMDSLLTDGRFKSQFETGVSGGTNSPSYRAAAEQKGLGIPTDIEPKQRPIYGYLDLGPSARGMVAQYGDLTFIVKDEVKQRATVTAGDSLYNFSTKQVAGTPLTAPTKASWDTSVDALYDYATGMIDHSGLVARVRYVEVQMQGGVTLNDMRAIVDRSGVLTAVQRQALKERGVEVWDN